MKVWKRNAIVATVLVLICAGVYLNWNASQNTTVDLMDTMDAQQVLHETQIVLPTDELQQTGAFEQDDYFAQIRLTRQESRDSAVNLLQETMSVQDESSTSDAAAASLDHIVTDALAEAQIESMVIAKGYADCVAYMSEDSISVAVSAPEEGLTEADVALISDIVTNQSDYLLQQVRIIEVK